MKLYPSRTVEIRYGRDGKDGLDGSNGNDGRNGEHGPEGEQGPIGDRGAEGPKGDKGERGPIGPRGLKGDKGEPGTPKDREAKGKSIMGAGGPGPLLRIWDGDQRLANKDRLRITGSGYTLSQDNKFTTLELTGGEVTQSELDAFTTRFRTQRTTSGSIAPGATANVPVTWATPFATTDYTVQATIEEDVTMGLVVNRIRSKTATQVVIRVQNNDPIFAHTGLLHIVGIAD